MANIFFLFFLFDTPLHSMKFQKFHGIEQNERFLSDYG